MSRRIVLRKATRIEGNASVHVEVDEGRVRAARFQVPDFRGFETIVKGCRVEQAPALVSRVCGLCSAAHQVASIDALERALDIVPPPGLVALREIVVLGEWIASHALAYFFLALPDMLDAPGGIFELARTHPELVGEAIALRVAGQRIVEILGGRAAHPVSLGIGRFLTPPGREQLEEIARVAGEAEDRARRLILRTMEAPPVSEGIAPPVDQRVNLLVHERGEGGGRFKVYGRDGAPLLAFERREFEDNVSEMRAEWSLSKFPYLTRLGFPAGIMLVGPLARTYGEGGILDDPEVTALGVPDRLQRRGDLSLDHVDLCRLVELFWAARRIRLSAAAVDLGAIESGGDVEGSGQGLGVVEAPRGVLIHSYLVDRGRVDRLRLLVATQFNNAFINLLLRDLAEKHVEGDRLTAEGERRIGRCIRLFDPCISCATH